MKSFQVLTVMLAALAMPAAAQAQEGAAAAASKPKEIVVVGSKDSDVDRPIILDALYNPNRAQLLEPADLDALVTGGSREATLGVPRGPFLEALRWAFENRQSLGDLSLSPAQAVERARYLTIKLEKVRVTSISPGDTHGRGKVQFHWDRTGGAAGAPLVGVGIGDLAENDNEDSAVEPPAPGQGWYRTPPYISLVVDGVEIARFSEVAGIESRTKPATIVLKRGVTDSRELRAWHEAVRMGNMTAARKSASLVMYDYDGKPVARYHLENAWPSQVELGSWSKAEGLDVTWETVEYRTETVTIVSESIQRVAP